MSPQQQPNHVLKYIPEAPSDRLAFARRNAVELSTRVFACIRESRNAHQSTAGWQISSQMREWRYRSF